MQGTQGSVVEIDVLSEQVGVEILNTFIGWVLLIIAPRKLIGDVAQMLAVVLADSGDIAHALFMG